MTAIPVPFVKVDERVYLDLLSLEAGMRDFADELERMGRYEAAITVRAICDDLWKSQKGGAEQTNS